MEGKTTRKTHQVLEGEDEGEEHGADGGVKKMGEQKWQFSYGERAVLRRAADGDDFDNDEIQEETDEDEYHDEDHDEEEEEEEEEESTALAQTQPLELGGESVKTNLPQLSRWRVDGKASRPSFPCGQHGDRGDNGVQTLEDKTEETVDGNLHSFDDSFAIIKRKLDTKSVRESQDLLMNREAADADVCSLCGECGHGSQGCPHKESEKCLCCGECGHGIRDCQAALVATNRMTAPGAAAAQRLQVDKTAAIKIQSLARGRKDRRRIQKLRTEKEAALTAEAETAAGKLQQSSEQNAINRSEFLQKVIDTIEEESVIDVPGFVREVMESLITKIVSIKFEEEAEARNKAFAEAEWRRIEKEPEAKTTRHVEETTAQQLEQDGLAEATRQEEAKRLELARIAIIMQRLFRGKRGRGFARDLREMRLLQLRKFEDEEKQNGRTAIIALTRRVPMQVLEFKSNFQEIKNQAIKNYKEKSSSIMATPDDAAVTGITVEILTLWPGASIANEAAIASALVNAARTEVRKGLVQGRVMKGALERGSLVKGLEKVNTIAQEFLSDALRHHLPLSPETVEERMASLKISIESKKRLHAYVNIECDKVMREMEEHMRSVNSDVSLLGLLAGAKPCSALRRWDPLAHLPNEVNARMLKSRERAITKESMSDRSRACQQRWQALEANLDNCRAFFTNNVLGICDGRGWDSLTTRTEYKEKSSYDAVLIDSFSRNPCVETDPSVSKEHKILRHQIADLFAPKSLKKPARSENGTKQLPWSDWVPGQFRRKHRDARYAEYCRTPEPQFITEIVLGLSESPAEHDLAQPNRYTVLPLIVVQNFNHALGKLDKEIVFRRQDRDERSPPTSALVSEPRWDHIRRILKMEPDTLPTKELFPTPRRIIKWRDRLRHAETLSVCRSDKRGYAALGRDSVLSMLSGDETRSQSRLTDVGLGRETELPVEDEEWGQDIEDPKRQQLWTRQSPDNLLKHDALVLPSIDTVSGRSTSLSNNIRDQIDREIDELLSECNSESRGGSGGNGESLSHKVESRKSAGSSNSEVSAASGVSRAGLLPSFE